MDLASRSEFVVDEFAVSNAIRRVLNNFAVPLGLWFVALLLAGYAVMPASLSGLKLHGPYLVLTGGLILSLAFRRGRAFFVLLSLAVAYFAFVFLVERGEPGALARIVHASICVFVPLNIGVFTLLRERGALNAPGLRRLSLPMLEIGAIAAILLSDTPEVAEFLYRPVLDNFQVHGLALPQWGILLSVTAVGVGVVCAVVRGSVIDAAFAVAAAAFALGCNGFPSPGAFCWFTSIAGLIVSLAVVQDSHRMAFYDELTGLPGRRALNERFAAIDGGFTLAMVDIDHFKSFNDTWGHDVGDQVLKLVAARLRRVGGGGTAYRYGGEEFAILFPGRRGTSVVDHLDALRKKIDEYKITLRHSGHRRNPLSSRGTPVAAGTSKWISVTISIGVGEREGRGEAADRIIEAADQALYRAKAQGRNRVVAA